MRQRQQRRNRRDHRHRRPAAASASGECGGKNEVTAEGSTAQQNAIAVFNQVWGQVCPGKNLSYNPTGSGAGREQFIAKQVDFAGSDSALKDEQIQQAADRCGGNPAWHLPLVFGPIAMAYNIEGVDKLVLNADVLGKIFQGQVTKWNDPAIAGLNAGTNLPDTVITPIYRSDSSGTTDNFQKYLTAAAPETWTKGEGSEFQGGAGEGAQKSAGVVQAVQATPGSIGYVEKGFAEQAGVPFAQIDSGAGAVELTDESAGKAIDAAKFAGDRQRPGAGPELAVRHEGGRRLPAGAGHLRDRLLEGLRHRDGRGGQVVPERRRRSGPGRTVGRRIHPAAGHVQGTARRFHRRNLINCVVSWRVSTIAVRMGT